MTTHVKADLVREGRIEAIRRRLRNLAPETRTQPELSESTGLHKQEVNRCLDILCARGELTYAVDGGTRQYRATRTEPINPGEVTARQLVRRATEHSTRVDGVAVADGGERQ